MKATSDTRLVLAPFKGLTNKIYRNAFARHFGGFDEYYAPFVSGVGTTRIHPSKLQDFVPLSGNAAPVVPQFISTDAKEIILLARTLHDHGYDHINWNLGCPFPRIAEKFRGCGILPYPEMLDELFREIYAKGIPLRLSVKTRLGYKEPGEILKILPILNNYPIYNIILHARTGKQVYRGEVDTGAFSGCLNMSKHPLVYNGDVYTLSRYNELRALFPQTDTWMLGRGALMNPFLATEIRGVRLTDEEKRERLSSFHVEVFDVARQSIPQENRAVGWMKAIWYYMSGLFSDGGSLFVRIRKTSSVAEYLDTIGFALQQPFSNDSEKEHYFRHFIRHV